MFNCYVHGWTSAEKPCPVCHPIKAWTSTDAIIDYCVCATTNQMNTAGCCMACGKPKKFNLIGGISSTGETK